MKLNLIIFGICSVFGACSRLKGNRDNRLSMNIVRKPTAVESKEARLQKRKEDRAKKALANANFAAQEDEEEDLGEFMKGTKISPVTDVTDVGSEASIAERDEDDHWQFVNFTQERRLVLVSNRVPIPDEHGGMPAGGLTTALEMSVRKMASTLWFGAHSEVSDDKMWTPDPKQVRDMPGVQLLPWILGESVQQGFYEHFSNGFLWPLCHSLQDRVTYETGSLEKYRSVVTSFAKRLLLFLQESDLLWIHDYHMIPLASSLRLARQASEAALRELALSTAGFFTRRGINISIPALSMADESLVSGLHLVDVNKIPIGFFFHIPVPPLSVWKSHGPFTTLEDRLRFCANFADYDLIGVHTKLDAENLADILRECCPSMRGLPEGKFIGDCEHKQVRVEVHPIGITPDEVVGDATNPALIEAAEGTLKKILEKSGAKGDRMLILGVDRLDYTKGLPERIRAVISYFMYLKERDPGMLGNLFFLQIASPSRENVDAYVDLKKTVLELAAEAKELKLPIHIHLEKVDRRILSAMYRMARVGLVTPLKDGMNLVAKEYVAAQDGEDPGVLILSKEAGAAQGPMAEGALIVTPNEVDIREKLPMALNMNQGDRIRNWRLMRDVFDTTAESWSTNFLTSLAQ